MNYYLMRSEKQTHEFTRFVCTHDTHTHIHICTHELTIIITNASYEKRSGTMHELSVNDRCDEVFSSYYIISADRCCCRQVYGVLELEDDFGRQTSPLVRRIRNEIRRQHCDRTGTRAEAVKFQIWQRQVFSSFFRLCCSVAQNQKRFIKSSDALFYVDEI